MLRGSFAASVAHIQTWFPEISENWVWMSLCGLEGPQMWCNHPEELRRLKSATLSHLFLVKFLKKNKQSSAVKSINRDWNYLEIFDFWLQILGSWQIWTQSVKFLRNIRHYEGLFIRRNIWETRANVCYWCFNVIFLSYMKKRRWEKKNISFFELTTFALKDN